MTEAILEKFSIRQLNAMQQEMLKVFPGQENIVLLSPTGSGKTLGYMLPLVSALQEHGDGILALIITPTRELAIQTEQVFRQMGTGLKVSCCYGGHMVRTEENNLAEAPSVLIGTPGRISYHIRHRNVNLEKTPFIILDEFDKSIELGFSREIEQIFGAMPGLRKKVLISATEGGEIPEYTGVSNPFVLSYLVKNQKTRLKQKYVVSQQNDKLDALAKLVGTFNGKNCLIFCNHRDAVERISEALNKQGVVHDLFHGKLEQQDRERALIKFRNGTTPILVTTDLAARGLDIPDLYAIIHYQLPPEESAFVHRNGRTARMHAEGTSYIILKEGEQLPGYVQGEAELEELPEEIQLPELPEWETIYFGAGKKDKINKIDIAGFLLQTGGLDKEDVGKIEVLDHTAYAAVKRQKVKTLLSRIRNEKIKKKQVKIDISR